MRTLGYGQCNGDHTLFFQQFLTGEVTILIVYVDDVIITGNNDEEAIKLEMQLTTHFEIKKLGSLKYFLGIEISQFCNGYLMTKKKYILDLLNETKHVQIKINNTPIEINHKLTISEEDPRIEIESYQRLIGK